MIHHVRRDSSYTSCGSHLTDLLRREPTVTVTMLDDRTDCPRCVTAFARERTTGTCRHGVRPAMLCSFPGCGHTRTR